MQLGGRVIDMASVVLDSDQNLVVAIGDGGERIVRLTVIGEGEVDSLEAGGTK